MNVFHSSSMWEPTHICSVCIWCYEHANLCVFLSFSFLFLFCTMLLLLFFKILLTDASWLFSLLLAESEQQVEGYYRLRAVDYWERPGPYSEVTKYTDNLWNVCALVTSPEKKVKSGIGSPDWNVSMVNVHLWKLLWVYHLDMEWRGMT